MEAKRLPIFRKRLLELRGKMNQVKFAEFLGISRTSVCLYESGTRIPDALILQKIAQRCNVSADWLLGLSDVKTQDGDLKQACQYTGLPESAIDRLANAEAIETRIMGEIIDNANFWDAMMDIRNLKAVVEVWDGIDMAPIGFTVSREDFITLLKYRTSRSLEALVDDLTTGKGDQNAEH